MQHAQPVASLLLSEDDLVQTVRARLDGRRGQFGRAAEDLGISQGELSNILRGGRTIAANVAAKLGYRRIVRFEPIDG